MCNRTCDTVLFFLYAHLQKKIMITSETPPPPPHTHIHTVTKCVSSGGKRGPRCPPPPSLEFEVQNNKS